MEMFAALEERIEKLIAAHTELQSRVATLEEENKRLRSGDAGAEQLAEKVAALETERSQIRARLEKLLKNLNALEL